VSRKNWGGHTKYPKSSTLEVMCKQQKSLESVGLSGSDSDSNNDNDNDYDSDNDGACDRHSGKYLAINRDRDSDSDDYAVIDSHSGEYLAINRDWSTLEAHLFSFVNHPAAETNSECR
jgi:hypothetical protein